MISAAEQEHQCMDTNQHVTQKQRSPTLYQSRSQEQQKIRDVSPSQEPRGAEVEIVREKISCSYYIAEQKPPISLFARPTNNLSDCASSEGSHFIKTNDEMSPWNNEGQFSVIKCPSILRIPFETIGHSTKLTQKTFFESCAKQPFISMKECTPKTTDDAAFRNDLEREPGSEVASGIILMEF